ncbi:MAG: SDR family oxidoreductase [Bacteroidota bacterium]
MVISILGCGWLGMALGRKMAQNEYFQVKGSTTTRIKLNLIEQAKIQAYLLDLSDHSPDDFFLCDVMVVTIPPSIPLFREKIKKVIEQLENHKVKKVVFVSTTSVYPNLNREVVERDAEYIKSQHSGVTMLSIEDQFRNCTGFQTTIIRFAGLYGPGREPGRFLAGKSNLRGAQSPVNLIHQDDCVEIISEIIKQNVWGETLNACSDVHPTRKEFYKKAALVREFEPPIFLDQSASFKIVSSEKLKSVLNYSFIHPNPIDSIK